MVLEAQKSKVKGAASAGAFLQATGQREQETEWGKQTRPFMKTLISLIMNPYRINGIGKWRLITSP